nr:hypothetical protein CFP56_26382 [Quercus suber]
MVQDVLPAGSRGDQDRRLGFVWNEITLLFFGKDHLWAREKGAVFLVVDPPIGVPSTIAEDSGCPNLVQRQFLVGSDLSFPVTEVGYGLTESEIPRLVWDDSLSSDEGEKAFNFVDITPLSLWDPNGGHDLITLEDDSDGSSMEEELEPLE